MKVKRGINTIFKAYDIRGVYPTEISEEIAFKIGQAFAIYIKKSFSQKQVTIAVAHDNRLSSPSLTKSLEKGLTEQGATVIDIGLATTPMSYYACVSLKTNGGVMVTSSHNPKNYNGFKLVREKAIPISQDSGLKEIKEIIVGNKIGECSQQGKIIKRNVLSDYVSFVTRLFNFKQFRSLKSLKIVVDTANAVPGLVVTPIFKKTFYHIDSIFKKLDGDFPNHQPNPLLPKNLQSLKSFVKSKKDDIGVAFDGDGDRIIFVDENGDFIYPDLITALMASFILMIYPGVKILYDVRSSNIVKDVIEKNGGIPVMARSGHSFIKEKMRKEDIFFGGEFSGHYYLKLNYFFESPFFVLFTILDHLSKSSKTLSDFIKPLKKYYHSPEINFKLANRSRIIREIENIYKNKKGKINKIDGLRVDFVNWWFNVRLSHTEPVLRLVVEADTKSLMEEKVKELTEVINTKSSFK